MMSTATKESPNGTVIQEPPGPPVEAQQLFSNFLKQHGLTLEVYVLAPKTGAAVPVAEFLPAGWEMVAVKAVISDNG